MGVYVGRHRLRSLIFQARVGFVRRAGAGSGFSVTGLRRFGVLVGLIRLLWHVAAGSWALGTRARGRAGLVPTLTMLSKRSAGRGGSASLSSANSMP